MEARAADTASSRPVSARQASADAHRGMEMPVTWAIPMARTESRSMVANNRPQPRRPGADRGQPDHLDGPHSAAYQVIEPEVRDFSMLTIG